MRGLMMAFRPIQRRATGAGAGRWSKLAWNYRLLIFAFCLFLLQFANAPMLPLARCPASTRVGTGRHELELVVAALIVVPQVITALIVAWVARRPKNGGARSC